MLRGLGGIQMYRLILAVAVVGLGVLAASDEAAAGLGEAA